MAGSQSKTAPIHKRDPNTSNNPPSSSARRCASMASHNQFVRVDYRLVLRKALVRNTDHGRVKAMAKPTNTNSSRDAIPRHASYGKGVRNKALVCLGALWGLVHFAQKGQHLWDSGGGRAFVPSLLAFGCAVL